MNPKQYVIKAKATENRKFKEVGQRLVKPKNIRLLHAAIGMVTETSEIILALKNTKKLNRSNLMEETGDILWYIAVAIDTLKMNPVEVLGVNKVKQPVIASDAKLKKEIVERLILIMEAMGDLQDLLKKSIFYGRKIDEKSYHEKVILIGRIATEMSELTGFELVDSMKSNIKKLAARYKQGKKAIFSNKSANVRNLKVETKILESTKRRKVTSKK